MEALKNCCSAIGMIDFLALLKVNRIKSNNIIFDRRPPKGTTANIVL